MYLVGEQGPELWAESRPGRIIPAGETQRLLAGGRQPASQPINIHVDAPRNADERAIARATADRLWIERPLVGT